jgi:arylsulfatase A-like enzyme
MARIKMAMSLKSAPRRDFLRTIGLGTVALSATTTESVFSTGDRKKPNIVYIMADDLGKEWISCYGAGKIKTPEIDELARTGIRFENFYCMPQCTPTRVSLLTGQYPCSHGFVNHWDVPRWGGGCHFDPGVLPSIGNVMKSAGYKTVVAGKWQIDDFRVETDACAQAGFDEYCMWTGGEGGNLEQSERRYWDAYIHAGDGSKIHKGRFGPDVYAEYLMSFMEKNRNEPMFIYYPMCLPHSPLTTTPLKPDVRTDEERFIAMVEYADYLTGRIVDKLDVLGLRDNTVIFWTADNGSGYRSGIRHGRTVKGGKGKTVEPGVNVPFIVNCPGWVPQGLVSDALSDVTDILPTLAELGRAELPSTYRDEGVSIADVILAKSQDSKREWIMAMGGQNNARMSEKGPENEWYWRDRVIRDKRFKLYVGTDKKPQKLFDLFNDPAEQHNIITSKDLEVRNAVKKLFGVIHRFPQKDNDFVCRPNPPQTWDVQISVDSGIWKKGRPE